MSENTLYRFPRLKGSQNWEFWALRMEAFIIDKGYDSALYPEIPMSEFTSKAGDINAYNSYLQDRKAKSLKAAALIRLAIEDGSLI